MTYNIVTSVIRPCDQACGATATVYAIDPIPNGWGGHYCQKCADALKFQVVDRYVTDQT